MEVGDVLVPWPMREQCSSLSREQETIKMERRPYEAEFVRPPSMNSQLLQDHTDLWIGGHTAPTSFFLWDWAQGQETGYQVESAEKKGISGR